MSKSILAFSIISLIISTCGCLSVETESSSLKESYSSTSIEEKPPHLSDSDSPKDSTLWQNTYDVFIREFEFLNDITPLSGENTIWSYSIRDLDSNDVGELLIIQSDKRNGLNANLTVYSYASSGIYKIGDYQNEKGSFVGGLCVSENPLFPGLFECWYGGGQESYGYLSLVNEGLIFENLWRNDHTTDSVYKEIISDNRQLIDESVAIYITNSNIEDSLLEENPINLE